MRYSLTWEGITPVAFADATNMVDSQYPFILLGGSATMRLNISEIFIGGEAPAASSPTKFKLARDSTLAATVTAGTCRNAAMDASATAPGTVPTFGHVATTKPQRSATLHLLALSCNMYGGIARWQARHGEEINLVGNAVNTGEVSLSAFTGGTPGPCSGHCIYEEA